MTNEVPHIAWGPTGEVVYKRTYSRTKPDGSQEVFPESYSRMFRGNLELVYGPQEGWTAPVWAEYDELCRYAHTFGVLPAGRHWWASGVKGRQYLFNCHVSGWGEKLSDHFEFTFMRLMEGGGVGANYSSKYLEPYGAPRRALKVHVVCDPTHPNYLEMVEAGLISTSFSHEWEGAFPVEDSREGWAAALVDLLDTYMTRDEVKHEDRVYDVSRVRYKGAPLRTFGGTASGPQPFAVMLKEIADVMNGAYGRFWACDWDFREGEEVPPGIGLNQLTPVEAMEIDHAIAQCVVSGGNRRSARMAMVRWDDPFILDFINCKANSGKHWTTNISVEIDDKFINALNSGGLHSRQVHNAVVKGMLTNGEPGYWNSSLSNEGEPNPVVCTNPCGEIALMEWENCNLGHVNLEAFAPTGFQKGTGDILGMLRTTQLVTRFLIRATYGDVNDEKQADILARNRRIGVGHLGVQGYLAKRGIRYSEAPQHKGFRKLLPELKQAARDEARRYAFELRIPEPVKVTTVAPTGTIAKMPGVTEGIHPIYARYFERRVRFNSTNPNEARMLAEAEATGYEIEVDSYDKSGNTKVVVYPTKEKLVAEVEAMGYDADIVESADELTVDQMLAFQQMYQELYADNAVSFTVNVPAEPHQQRQMLENPFGDSLPPTPERLAEVADVIRKRLPYLKGTTIMVDGARPQAPYTRISKADFDLQEATLVADGTNEECANGACPVR